MIDNRQSGRRLVLASFGIVLLAVTLLHATPVVAKSPAETPAEANAFLDRFVGHWVGEGRRYELYTFNNNTALGSSLPARHMTGRRDGDRLVMEEKPGPRSVRYTFEFLDRDTFRLTKSFPAKKEPPFVTEVFRRK